ncbi:MAG: hypothetical protein ACREQR_04100 [Candidatus Binataceae bacterium]
MASDSQKPAEREVVSGCVIICDFESIAGQRSLKDLGKLIGRYYSVVAEAVLASDGDISEFCGPKIVIRYGAFKEVPIAEAVAAADALRQELTRLESELEVRIGFGVCRGPVLLGRFGSASRATFSAIGPPIICSEQIASSGSAFGICQSLAEQIPRAECLKNEVSVHPRWSPPGRR